MTIKRGVSVDAQFVPNATGSLFAPATGITRAQITSVTMYANVATTNVELFILPSGGSASTTTRTTQKDFAANETYTAPELIGQSIETGGSLQGNDGGNGGTDVNIIITVTNFSGDS